jgi:hypothetical protein
MLPIRPEANNGDAGFAEDGGEFTFAGQTKDERFPAAAVQARNKLHEGSLGSASIQVSDAKRNSGWLFWSRH